LFVIQAEEGIRDRNVTGVQTCALPICIHDYSIIPTIKEEDKNLVVTLDEKADTEFIEAVKKQVIRKELIEKVGKEFKIVFTPLRSEERRVGKECRWMR